MLNKKLNLTLKLNRSLTNVSQQEFGSAGPLTPVDQTLSTPIDAPANFMNASSHHASYFPSDGPSLQDIHYSQNSQHHHQHQHQPHPLSQQHQQQHQPPSLYSNPAYNESDDILTDIDEPSFGSVRTIKKYTLTFTPAFDQLVMSVYSYILSLPTTTPFTGVTPPSGLVSRVANETLNSLIAKVTSGNAPQYDQQNIINLEYLKDHTYQPIFLQLIRKRLLDLCTFHTNKIEGSKLPATTTITITVNGNGNTAGENTNSLSKSSSSSASSIYGTNVRQSSISNLSLTDANVANYNNNLSSAAAPPRSRSSSLNLRKQSLTRNNSYSGNNWLHVGNLNNIRPHNLPNQQAIAMNGTNGDSLNRSTDSLQSMQDFVPQSFINRSATSTGGHNSTSNLNAMSIDYQTPPSSQKSSISSCSSNSTPFNAMGSNSTIINQQQGQFSNGQENIDDFNLSRSRSLSRTSSRNGGGFGTGSITPNSAGSSNGGGSFCSMQNHMNFPRPLTINTEYANTHAASIAAGGGSNGGGIALDSPFMSATTPSEEYGYFMNGHGVSSGSSMGSANSQNSPNAGVGGININGALNNGTSNVNTSISMSEGSPIESLQEVAVNKINLPGQFSLSEKKRDSLKMKRGIH